MKTQLQATLRHSLEAFDDAPLAPTEEPVQVDTAPVDETQIAEFSEEPLMQQAGEVDSDTQVLENAAASLEAIVTAMEAHREHGLNPTAAQFAQISIANVYRTLDLNVPQMASMESFETDPVQATTASMEDLKKFSAAVWDTILKMMAKLRQLLGEFYRYITSGAARMVSKARKVAEKAEAIKSLPQGRLVLTDIGQLGSKLVIEDRLPSSAAKVVEALEQLAEAGVELDDRVWDRADRDVQLMAHARLKGDLETAVRTWTDDLVLPKMFGPARDAGSGQGAKVEDFTTTMLPGNVQFRVRRSGFNIHGLYLVGYDVYRDVRPYEGSPIDELPMLQPAEIKLIAERTGKIAKSVEAMSASRSKRLAQLQKEIDALRNLNGPASGMSQINMATATTALRLRSKMVGKVGAYIGSYTVGKTLDYLRWAEMSADMQLQAA